MTRPNLQKRSAMHHRRGLHLQRAEAVPAKAADATSSSTPTPRPTAPDRPRDRTTTAPVTTTHSVLPLVPSISIPPDLGLVSISTTSRLTSSSTPSTTANSVTSSVTSHSLPTAQSIPPTTPPSPYVVVQTTTRPPPPPSQTPSATAQPSSGLSTVTIIGGIGGAVGGTILLTVIIGFLLRRWRKRKALDSAFDSDEFRRSATLLIEKDDNNHGRPRPPTMIERKNVAPTAAQLSAPSAAYPYSDQPPSAAVFGNERVQSFAHHGAVVLQPPSFSTGNQFGGAPNAPAMHYGANSYSMDYGQGDPFASHAVPGQSREQSGYGAPPIPGTHGPGAYAPYGVDPRYPQYQRLPRHQQYSQQQHPAADSASDTSLSREESAPSLANPFSPLPVPTKMLPTDGPDSTSTSSSSPTEPARGASFVTRQSQEAPPAYTTQNEMYADMKRDVKVSPSNTPRVVNGNPDSPKTVDTPTMSKSNGSVPELRPLSSFTLYNDDDAYGGM